MKRTTENRCTKWEIEPKVNVGCFIIFCRMFYFTLCEMGIVFVVTLFDHWTLSTQPTPNPWMNFDLMIAPAKTYMHSLVYIYSTRFSSNQQTSSKKNTNKINNFSWPHPSNAIQVCVDMCADRCYACVQYLNKVEPDEIFENQIYETENQNCYNCECHMTRAAMATKQ